MNVNQIERIIKCKCEEYVERWKNEGKRYISVPCWDNIYAEGNSSPIEQQCCLKEVLKRLHNENPEFPSSIPELPINILRKLPVYLSKTLEIQVNKDHYDFWEWSERVFMNPEIRLKILRDLEQIREVLQILFRTVRATSLNTLGMGSKMILATPLAYICFEAILRYLCSDYVDETGKAKQNFRLKIKNRNVKEEKGKYITLVPLLRTFDQLVLKELTAEEFKNNIVRLNEVIEEVWGKGGKDWIDVLGEWRNNFLHGINTWIPRAFGIVTNYICLIFWRFVPDDYKGKF